MGIKKQKSNASIPTLKMNGKETDDHTIIANAFNKFFVSIASNLKEPIEYSNFEKLKAFCHNRVPEGTIFSIPEISKEYIEKFLKHILMYPKLLDATILDHIS